MAKEAFRSFGDIRILPGREITPETVRDTDILICRHVTKVNKGLLDNSKVKFVGTATAGFEHVDMTYLRSKNIGFAHAAGGNSNSVAEYIVAGLLALHRRGRTNIPQITLGVVGVGNVGNKVVKKARALGIKVLCNDPPLARQTHDPEFLPLDDLMNCDIITLHVPLNTDGPDATRLFFDSQRLAKMKRGSILINSCRGQVVEEPSLKQALRSGQLSAAMLDVWFTEPLIDLELLSLVELGTAHIAGLSLEGKTNGTSLIYQALCKFLGTSPSWQPQLPPVDIPSLDISLNKENFLEKVGEVVQKLYNIENDDSNLRKQASLPQEERAKYFDGLRKNYRRREFFNTRLRTQGLVDNQKQRLLDLGFTF